MLPNLFRTLLFNIKAFGLLKGLKLPVYVYSKVMIYHIGRIEFKCPVSRGLITIGMNKRDEALCHTIWDNNGTIEVSGRLFINFGVKIVNQGVITFGGDNAIGSACTITIEDRLDIGHDTSFGRRTDIMDSDSHFLIDVESRTIQRNSKPIRIGNYNWFGSNTFVKKGTVTPDYLLVASPNALLCKDYSEVAPYTIMAGSPARPIASGKRRLYNFSNERKVRNFFANKQDNTYIVPPGEDLDAYCGYGKQ